MITLKDKIDQFKRDCRSNDYYTKMIIDCNDRLEEIAEKLRGVSAVTCSGVKYENVGDPYKERKLHWLYLEEEVMKERNEYINRINDINEKLSNISDPIERQMIIDLYINKLYYKEVARKYHYSDHASMYKHVNKIIAKII